jgi:hypothetical protein
MDCAHDGFYTIRSEYDRRRRMLVYFWTCDGCDARLDEVRRDPYEPRYDPHGNDGFTPRQAQPAT